MKFFIATGIIIFSIGIVLNAQKLEYKLNAGVNSTFVSDFNNSIYILNDGLVIPNYINVSNSITSPIKLTTKAKTSVKIGYFVQFDICKKINDRLVLSFSGGISSVKYNYETVIDISGTPYKILNDDTGNYGTPNFLYINIKPLIASLVLLQDKFELSAGPSFNFLINSNYTKNVIIYNNNLIERVYFEQTKGFNKLLYGFYLKTSYQIVKHVDLMVSYQYYFNSIYDIKNTNNKVGEECKPGILEFGLGYSF